MVSKCNLPHLPFTVLDRAGLGWAAHANPKKGATILKAVHLAVSRANGRIDAYMKANFKPPGSPILFLFFNFGGGTWVPAVMCV